MADEACRLDLKAWEEVENYDIDDVNENFAFQRQSEACPSSIWRTREDLAHGINIMFLPGSLQALVLQWWVHHNVLIKSTNQNWRSLQIEHDRFVMVSQFALQLQGLKSLEGDAKMFYLSNRLIRDNLSHELILEHNTYDKKQWGKAQTCAGSAYADDEYLLIDGHRRCEKWMQNDVVDPKVSKTTSSFKRFILHKKQLEVTRPIPFAEGKMFILSVRAGIEGYHISVGGNVDVHSIFATALPISHPGFSPPRVLEMSERWKAQPLKKKPAKLFIGVASRTNHFSERMSVRKTRMQYPDVKSSEVVVRFFVALSERKEVNIVLKKEASCFGDIVILPYVDCYELVVLKTITICGYGVQDVMAAYIMKCDDDTFIKLDTLLRWIMPIPPQMPLYMGKLNYLIRPVREGKWAVSYEE
ncbi:LOW QUALITY PROTEIN: hypothetical protein Cgig2_019169 [Carnegiea gigantea]|uniref:Hexosyltransferase n=1 Tax=Carnegiea gigantea TaxID=171969 RepID=A0A9Q1JKN5_9CARY|nr:LOW QUALITY PROTEIN: hypothetical protein Cgig2_019169 [Carnegiea gigantea]